MIPWLAVAASAAPVLVATPADPVTRCVQAARTEAGLDAPAPAEPLGTELQRVAVVVGVPCHRSPSIPSLAYSTRDATRVADTLEQRGYGVRRLTSLVDRADLEAALDEAEAALAPDGELVVYFSGHGVLRETDGRLRRYLVLSDTELDRVERTGWRVRDLDDRVSRMPAARRIVIQDTCFAAEVGEAGAKSLGLPADAGRPKGLTLPEGHITLQPGDLRLYASRFYEQALESVEHRGSVYTHHLLQALGDDDADLDGDGCVGALEAHTDARDRTMAERKGFQVPQLDGEHTNPALGCQPGAAAHAVVVEPTGDWSVELRRGDEVVREAGAVTPGRWQVEVREWTPTPEGDLRARRLLDGRIALAPGEWVDLADEVERRGPLGTVGAGVTVSPGGALPALAGSLDAWRATAQRGAGRLALSGMVSWTPGPGRYDDPRLGFRGGTAEVGGGWWASLPLRGADHLAVGPSVTAGALWRTARNTDDPMARLPTRAGWSTSPTVHTHVALGPVVVGVDAGARLSGLSAEAQGPVLASPLLRMSVGPRL